MYRFSFVENVSARAQEVTRETFQQLMNREQVARTCAQIKALSHDGEGNKEEIGRLKRSLPAFCWHAWFDQGKRKNYAAHASGLIMIDLDHVEDPMKLYEELVQDAFNFPDRGVMLSGHQLLAAHITPSTKGLRLVFSTPPTLELEKAQTEIVKDLRLQNVDACTKDLARLSFCVPAAYWLYVDEKRLFDPDAAPPVVLPVPDEPLPPAEEADTVKHDTAETVQREPGKYEETYAGIPYALLVDTLCNLMGGSPEHGSRNNFIFAMATYLRYVCNDDPEWICQVLPTYGEQRDKWQRTIQSACNRAQHKEMPELVKRAMRVARRNMETVAAKEKGTAAPPPLPAKLPKLIQHLVKNVPEVCKPAVASGVFPALAAHLHGVKFLLIDGTEKEATFMCVNMAKQSSGKSALNRVVDFITADIVKRDELNRQREQEWKDEIAKKGANKEKPKRPDDLCVQVLVSDMTNAAFVQRMKDAGGRYLYTNLEELDLLRQLQTNGTKDVGKIICLCFDNGKYGQERVGTQSVTARVEIRWNWNASSTIQKGLDFFKGRLVDGTLSRINFCTIIPDKTKPFHYGIYDEKYAEKLKPYIDNLNRTEGIITCNPAQELAQQMLDKCMDRSALCDDDIYQDLAYRAVTIAYLKAMVLYIAQDMTWSREIAQFAEWSLEYDLWCKLHFFGEKVREAKEREDIKHSSGPQNLLNLLPDCFSREDAQDMRRQQGIPENPKNMLSSWTFRGYIEWDQQTGRYIKTSQYLKRFSR